MTPNSISATVVAAVAAWALAPAPARANDPPSKANAPSTGSIRIVGADRTSPTGDAGRRPTPKFTVDSLFFGSIFSVTGATRVVLGEPLPTRLV